MVAIVRPASVAICRSLVSVSACVVGVAWLNLKRAMSMPAATRACSVSGLRLAGPMVAAICGGRVAWGLGKDLSKALKPSALELRVEVLVCVPRAVSVCAIACNYGLLGWG